MRTHRDCPVCRTPGRPVYENRMAPLDELDMSYTVAECPGCGFAFASALPDSDRYRRYYSDYSKYDLIRDKNAIPRLVSTMAESEADFIQSQLGAEVGVFDIGCSVGVFLDACKRKGFRRVAGIDPAPQAAALGKALFDVDIETGFFDGSQDLAAWDVVSLIAVLEHLTEPQASFAAFAKAMRPGSHLLIVVPAADRFAEIDGEAFGEFSLEHINFFGAVSLRRLAAQHGFTEVASDYPFYANNTWGLRSLFRLDGPPTKNEQRDTALQASLQRYIDAGRAAIVRQSDLLRAWSERPLAVYGAGSHTARLLALPAAQDLRILALVDGNPNLQGKTLGGHVIQAPDALRELDAPVIISTYQARHVLARVVTETYNLQALHLYPA